MKVADLLKGKAGPLMTCAAADTVQTAAKLLSEKKIGALAVLDSKGRPEGLISERDICRGVATGGSSIAAMTVGDLMNRDLAVCTAEDSVRDSMMTMSRRHIRHLPVLKDDKLIGMISQRDVLGALLRDTQLEIGVLRDYARAKA